MTRDDVMPGRAGPQLNRHPADQSSLKQLKPLPTDPPMTPAAQRVIDGLTWRYAHEEASRRPATQSVSALSKPTGGPVASDAPVNRALAIDELPLPRVMQTDTAITAADRGTYTHTVLQHLDFARPCIGDDLKQQIDALVDRRLLLESQAAEVQQDTIEWMMTSRVGHLLHRHAHELLREVTIYLSHGSAPDPRDNIMVRGRVDLIIPTPTGHIVVDYKTDCVTSKSLHARADFYAEQVKLYNDAIHRITGQPPIDVWLVFLHAKQIICQATPT